MYQISQMKGPSVRLTILYSQIGFAKNYFECSQKIRYLPIRHQMAIIWAVVRLI